MPDDVINTIIAMLDDVKPVLRLSQTSHRFASRASRPELWRKLLQDHWGAAAVEEFGNAASCARTFFARTRVVPTSLQDAELETAWAPERFVPMPFSEYHMLVEIMHQGPGAPPCAPAPPPRGGEVERRSAPWPRTAVRAPAAPPGRGAPVVVQARRGGPNWPPKGWGEGLDDTRQHGI